jgi:F0F1-type ATP synthase delta subunit
MSARAQRRLPGFRFETQAPILPEVLPRMDIAVFVGFAASGPLQTPVVIETEQQFAAIFGEDAPLAWDVERGEQVYAYLGPAVRAFFRNGGRRCWIIRVARQTARETNSLNRARSNSFPIPCLARAEFNSNGTIRSLTPAFARARSEGRNLLALLAENDRLGALTEISAQFDQLKAEQENRVAVTLVSASAVDAAQAEKISGALSRRLGRSVDLTLEVDPSLIGGAVIRAKDMVIDDSLQTRLKRLASALAD